MTTYFNFLFDEMMSDFLNLTSLILFSFGSDRSSINFKIACDFASILLKISSWRSSLSLSATRESTSIKISFTKCIAFNNFSCSILSSIELFSNGWINSGYFVSRWVTNRMHSGMPFFFNSGFWRQCLYHSVNVWSSVMYHLNVLSAERWLEQNSPENGTIERMLIDGNSITSYTKVFPFLLRTGQGDGNEKTETRLDAFQFIFYSPYALFNFCDDRAEKNSTKISAMLSIMWFSRCFSRNFLRNLEKKLNFRR